MTLAWSSDDYLRDECEEDAKLRRTQCPYCSTRGDHYCPSDVAHGPEDGECVQCGNPQAWTKYDEREGDSEPLCADCRHKLEHPELRDEPPARDAIRNYWLSKSAGGFFLE